MSPLTYLASPYTHDNRQVILERTRQAEIAAAKLMMKGHVVFSPIAHSHAIAEHIGNHVDGSFWQKQDEPYLRFCDRMVVLTLPGWEQSKGVTYEIAVARERGIPIEFMEPDHA